MTISPAAIDRFRNRQLKDSAFAKTIDPAQLDERIAALDPAPAFDIEPWHHQKVAFLLGANYTGYNFWLDPGLGKTKVILELVKWRKAKGDVECACVLVPFGANIQEWYDVAKEHTPSLKIGRVSGTAAEKRAAVEDETNDVIVMTFAYFVRLMTRDAEKRNRKTGKMETVRVPDYERLAQMASWCGFWCYDETTVSLRNHGSITVQLLRELRKHVPYVYGLTGTPMNADPQDLWAQFMVVDGGATLGHTLGIYRGAYFKTSVNRWGGYQHKFLPEYTDDLARIVRNRSVRYKDDECLDLPAMIGGLQGEGGYKILKADWTPAGRREYQKVCDELKASKGEYKAIDSAFIRMRQASSGYVGVKGDGGKKVEIEFSENPKVQVLLDLIETLPADRKIVVVAHLRATCGIIRKALRKAKHKTEMLIGGMTDKKRTALLDAFRVGDSRVLVINEAGAYGLNIPQAHYMVFFESPTTTIVRKQFEKRIHRGNSTHKAVYFEICMKASHDEIILDCLRDDQDVYTTLIERGMEVSA